MLEARGLTYEYRKGHPILDNVSLTLQPGEVLGLSAPSGRGKTTLCRILAGYESPLSGEVLVDGKPLPEWKGYCPVQLLWQHPEQVLDPRMKMGRTLREAGLPDSRILQALGIEEQWMDRYPGELSGGEQQRFCIARALGEETRYLLADEMTAMLDLITQAGCWQFLLEETKRRNIGLLVVSHDEALLEKVCQQIFVF